MGARVKWLSVTGVRTYSICVCSYGVVQIMCVRGVRRTPYVACFVCLNLIQKLHSLNVYAIQQTNVNAFVYVIELRV